VIHRQCVSYEIRKFLTEFITANLVNSALHIIRDVS